MLVVGVLVLGFVLVDCGGRCGLRGCGMLS